MLSGLENPIHLLFLFLIILLLFGAKRLPEIGRGLGSGIRAFKNALTHAEPNDPPVLAGNHASSAEPTSAIDLRADGTKVAA